MSNSTQSISIPAISTATAADPPVQLVQWQNVPTSALQPFAPDPSVPMGAYAVTTVMLWAQAQGWAGAIPTWEVGADEWGVITFANHPALSLVSVPLSELASYDLNDPAGTAQSFMRWANTQQSLLAIPTFQSDGTNATALFFAPSYPGLAFYDAPNAQLVASLQQARALCNLQDPAVWANAAMRTAMQQGFAAGWPTWEWTTSRGLIGIAALDFGPLPEPTDENVKHVLKVLNKSITTLKFSLADALGDFSGIYDTFNAAPITDPGLQILTDCIFGALEIAVNAIPVVGGALGALISAAVTVAQDAANQAGGTGPTTLEQYQSMLSAATDATVLYVSGVHDALLDAKGKSTLPQVWAQPYQNPLGGPPTVLGVLANSPNDVVNGDTYWNQMGDQITAALNQNLQASITAQLYTITRRTFQNAPLGKQWWYGTVASVTAADGPMAEYIASADDELSVWFTDYVLEPGHALGSYVTSTEFWLQAPSESILPEYPPAELCYALFSSDGFGNTQRYTGAFAKSTVYDNWLMSTQETGSNGMEVYLQKWSYGVNGNLVSADISVQSGGTPVNAGYTDAYGNLYLNGSNSTVRYADETFGFQQNVIVNYLAPLG